MSEVIYGKDNPKAKYLRSLHDRKKASAEGLVFIEGIRLCEDALKTGAVPTVLAYTSSKEELVRNWIGLFCLDLNVTELLCFSDDLFAKICSTVNPQGVAMVVKEPDLSSDIPFRGDKDIYVCLENLQDPGNMGTVIRLADAFDFTSVILCGNCCDPYNEKVLRSSMGSVWHVPIRKLDNSSDVFNFCRSNGIKTMAMHLKGDDLKSAPISLPCCYFIGNEGKGLSDELTASCDLKVKIPMPGKAESLNAASAASVIGYILSSLR